MARLSIDPGTAARRAGDRLRHAAATLALAAVIAGGCSVGAQEVGVWTTLLDGTTLDGWNQVGTSNWTASGGAVQADHGSGVLVTPEVYSDFELRAEVWVSDDANSGIFFRGDDPHNVTPETAYEMNIFDKRPEPEYRTGAIVGVASPLSPVDAGGHWNTVEIVARGPRLSVTFNSVRTVDVEHAGHTKGVIALQCATGSVKFRRVEIRSLSPAP